MERGRVVGTELMLKLVVGNTELGCGKLKRGNRFLKLSFEPGPSSSYTHLGDFDGELVLRHPQV